MQMPVHEVQNGEIFLREEWGVVNIKISDIVFFTICIYAHCFFTPMTEFYLNTNTGMLM
jgi:hypothetical protein